MCTVSKMLVYILLYTQAERYVLNVVKKIKST